ncbi:sulfotransferase family 2 domain-containing protein [Microbulbifer sp. SSSA008]|uniref:sulfotransferase family 2 domain-containing protein n=1 Tax=Microbulbifer sp. SSSA008 TaxID=3243380 RepID=UPI00403A627E
MKKLLMKFSRPTFKKFPVRLVPPPKIFFCHIPKCAGSSLHSAISSQYYEPNKLGSFNIKRAVSKRAADVLEMPMMSVRETVMVHNLSINSNYYGHGHSFCRPNVVKNFSNEWNFITVLRNPIDRWISLYTYNTYKKSQWDKNSLPLDKYIESQIGVMTGQVFIRYFSDFSDSNPSEHIEQALKNLQQISIVGTTNHLDKLTQQISKDFDIKLDIPKINKSPNTKLSQEIKTDAKAIKKIEKICQYDMEIYKRFTDKHGPIFSGKSYKEM